MAAPTLTTGRLVLRPWRNADLAPFRALNADPAVMQYFPSVLDAAQSDAVADRIRQGLADREFGFWAVEAPGVAGFIGFVGLSVPGFSAHFTPCIEIGWRLAAEHWRKGYASEAAAAALRHAFGTLQLGEVVSFAVAANRPSIAVMQRIGMSHDPADGFDHPNLPIGSPLRRHVLYRQRREVWLRRQA
jgi:ribosomal-protein-alanine N-acetyltransferase